MERDLEDKGFDVDTFDNSFDSGEENDDSSNPSYDFLDSDFLLVSVI